jgi:hypothetical protein
MENSSTSSLCISFIVIKVYFSGDKDKTLFTKTSKALGGNPPSKVCDEYFSLFLNIDIVV